MVASGQVEAISIIHRLQEVGGDPKGLKVVVDNPQGFTVVDGIRILRVDQILG